jgi:hypothetical protein
MTLATYLGQRRSPTLQCNKKCAGTIMPEYFDHDSEQRSFVQRSLGGWRVVASAWAVAILVVLGFGGMQALASRHAMSMHDQQLVGAVIPRHDASCDLLPTADCHVVGSVLDNAEAEAEAHAAYGL